MVSQEVGHRAPVSVTGWLHTRRHGARTDLSLDTATGKIVIPESRNLCEGRPATSSPSGGVAMGYIAAEGDRDSVTSTNPPKEVFLVDPDVVANPASAANDGVVALLSSGDVTGDLSGAGVDLVDLTDPGAPAPEHADAVVLGGAGPEFTYDALDRAFELLLGGAELAAMHRGLTWRTARGIQLDAGAFLAGLERAAGVRATVVGKPEPAMFAAGLAGLGAAPAEVVMIGDDLEGDVRGAQRSGIAGVLARTGKFRPAALQTPGEEPDLLADDFASAIAALRLSG